MRISCTAFSAILLGIAATLQAADVTGKWKSDFETQIGHLNYVYVLKLDGDKLSGKAIRTLEDAKTETELQEAKLTGDTISFVEPIKVQDNDIRIEYSGKVAGDEMKLTRKVGDFATTEIVAKREKDTEPSITGKWQSEFESQIGKQKYIFELKTDGNKLTGHAKGEFADQKSDTEITDGKINGAELSFVENVKFGDQEIHIDYKGKISGDEIKLTRKVGDIATEEIVAKRVKEPAK